jgi:hypothetical protein
MFAMRHHPSVSKPEFVTRLVGTGESRLSSTAERRAFTTRKDIRPAQRTVNPAWSARADSTNAVEAVQHC